MLKRFLIIYGSKAFYAVLLVGVSVYVARVWGPAALGEYSVLLTLLASGSVLAVFGADMRYIETAPKLVGEIYKKENVYATQVVVAVLLQSLIVLPAVYLLIRLVVPGLGAAAIALIPMAIVTILGGILISQNRQVLNSVLVSILRPSFLFAGVFLAGTSLTIFSIAIASSLALSFMIVAVIGVLMVCAPTLKGRSIAPYFSKSWWSAAWVYVVIGLYPILFAQADRLILIELLGPLETGIYSAAQNILNIPNYAVNAAMALALPMISSVLAGKISESDFSKGAKRLARTLFGFAVLCVVVFAFFGDRILNIFGGSFVAAQLPLLIMSLGVAIGLVFGFPISVLTLSSSRRSVVWLFLSLLAGSLILSAVGIMWFGVLGAALASAVSNIAMRGVFHAICVRRTGISTAIF